MRANVTRKLRDFWDAGIRGPDFVWAATGAGARSLLQAPGGEEGRRSRRTDDRLGVPARGAPDGGGLRRRSRVDRRRGRERGRGERPRRRDHLLPAAPGRFRPGRGARRGLHPLRAVVQPLRPRPLRPLRPPVATRPYTVRRVGRGRDPEKKAARPVRVAAGAARSSSSPGPGAPPSGWDTRGPAGGRRR